MLVRCLLGSNDQRHVQAELSAALVDCNVHYAAFYTHTDAIKPQLQTTTPAEETLLTPKAICPLYAHPINQTPFTAVSTRSPFSLLVRVQVFETAGFRRCAVQCS